MGLSDPTGVIHGADAEIYTFITPQVALNKGDGPVVGVARLVLLFWGEFWSTATHPLVSAADITAAVTDVLNSPYLSEMPQYGFQALTIDPPTIVIAPGPPFPRFTYEDPKNMVWDLIDDGKFPEPDDDNGRIVYMVFAPKGSTYDQLVAGGAHGDATDFDIPTDTDHAWVGWVDYGSIDDIMVTFTHELVEILSDPEPSSGWTVNAEPLELSEIGDICLGQEGMDAGHAVAAYYSNRLKSCVVPGEVIPRSVRLKVTQGTIGAAVHLEDGSFTFKKPTECFSGTYGWSLWGQGEQAVVTADFSSYISPDVTWTVNGKTVFAVFPFPANVTVPADDSFDPLSHFTPMPARSGTVAVSMSDHKDSLTVTIAPGQPWVELNVTCEVEERAFPRGYNLSRKTSTTLLLSGSIRVFDLRYAHDLFVCASEWLRRAQLTIINEKIPRIDRGDPIPPWVDRELGVVNQKVVEEARQALSLAADIEPFHGGMASELRGLADSLLAQARGARVEGAGKV